MVKVSEMKAEYFPPKEDVILQNEAPTDFYVLVTGSVVSSKFPPFRIVFPPIELNGPEFFIYCVLEEYIRRLIPCGQGPFDKKLEND